MKKRTYYVSYFKYPQNPQNDEKGEKPSTTMQNFQPHSKYLEIQGPLVSGKAHETLSRMLSCKDVGNESAVDRYFILGWSKCDSKKRKSFVMRLIK